MVWQVALGGAMVAGQLLNGYLQYQNAEETRADAANWRRKAMELVDKLQTPDFNWEKLTPEEYQLVGKFAPQTVEFVAEQAPQAVEGKSEAAQQAQRAQLEALGKYQQMAETGRDIESDILTKRAREEVGAADRALKAQMLQDIRRRGVGGGAEITAALASSQAAGNRGARMAEDAAMEAARRRLEAIRQSGALGGQIRGQELGMESKNVDIINEFNRRQAARKQAWAGEQADVANRAQMFNLQQAQNVADTNVQQRNLFARENLERENRLKQAQFAAEKDKTALATGQYSGAAQDEVSAGRDRAQQIQAGTDALTTLAKFGYDISKDKKRSTDELDE